MVPAREKDLRRLEVKVSTGPKESSNSRRKNPDQLKQKKNLSRGGCAYIAEGSCYGNSLGGGRGTPRRNCLGGQESFQQQSTAGFAGSRVRKWDVEGAERVHHYGVGYQNRGGIGGGGEGVREQSTPWRQVRGIPGGEGLIKVGREKLGGDDKGKWKKDGKPVGGILVVNTLV